MVREGRGWVVKMRIKVIIPNSSVELRDEQASHRRSVAGPATSLDIVCLPRGPVSVESAVDEAYASPYLLEEIRKAEGEGYDALTVDGALDPCLRAGKEVTTLPVVSGGEASRVLALVLGDKFSVITMLSNAVGVIESRITASGMESRCASVRSVEIPVLELKNYAKTKKRILAEAKKAIHDDGADVIVLGCTAMAKLARELQEELKVPVVEPASAAIKVAETLVQMKLAQSKLSYPKPPRKQVSTCQYS